MCISDRLTGNRLNSWWPVLVCHNRCLNFGLGLLCHHCSIAQQRLLYALSNKCMSTSSRSRLEGPYLRCAMARAYDSGGCIYDLRRNQVISVSLLTLATLFLTVGGPVHPAAGVDVAIGRSTWCPIHTGESLAFFCQQCDVPLSRRCCSLCLIWFALRWC